MGKGESRSSQSEVVIGTTARKWKVKRKRSVFAKGQKIPDNIRRLIAHHLEKATFPTKADLASALGVSYETVNRIYQSDPEIQEKWAMAMERKLTEVEMAGFEMAINGEHPIAKEKMIEFLLTHHKPDVYGDGATNKNALSSMPKIVIPIQINRTRELPTVGATISLGCDEAPVAQAEAVQAEVIDV